VNDKKGLMYDAPYLHEETRKQEHNAGQETIGFTIHFPKVYSLYISNALFGAELTSNFLKKKHVYYE
jgi:hypothetical protein